MQLRNYSKGFTLIELLVVIGIIAILAATVIIAINPARQFAQTRNTRRWSDVNAILNAIHQYAIDNNGNLPSQITNTPTDAGICCLGLKTILTPRYIVDIPFDPSTGNATTTRYLVSQTGTPGYRLTVSAMDRELEVTISVSR